MRLTINDLERDSGLARRTIHYYTREGLLPAPIGLGRGAAYGEEHLLRLRLICVLKIGGLRLDRIAGTLDSLSLRQMRRLVELAGNLEGHDPPELAVWLRSCQEVERPRPAAPAARPPTVVDRPWIRHRVRDGLEIHYCPDADDDFRRRVGELQRLAARLFNQPE